MEQNKRHIWQFPWKYAEGILLVGGLIIIGFILQLIVGNFNYFLLKSPANLIFGGAIILFLILFSFARKTSFYQWFSGVPFSVTLIAALLLLGLIMGLTPQFVKVDPHNHSILAQLGFRQVTSSWPFVMVYFVTLLSLGSLISRRLIAFNIKDYAFYFNHIGLWVLLFSAGFGAADIERYVMHVREGEVEWRVYTDNNDVLELPIAIQLNNFDMEEYAPPLMVIDRETGRTQPEGKPALFHLDLDRPKGELLDWDIELKDYIHYAVRNSDSTYQEIHMPGASPAAKITATNKHTGEVKEGWLSGGNMSQLYMMLPLDSQYTIIMDRPAPKKFMSDIKVFLKQDEEGENVLDVEGILEVNKPIKIGDWTVYQFGYDEAAGRLSTYSSIELVRDPWLTPAYIGIALLAIGSICLLWSGNKNRRREGEK